MRILVKLAKIVFWPALLVVLWKPVLWPSLILFFLFILGAFLRLLISRETYKQQAVDMSKLRTGDVLLFGSNSNLHSFPIKIVNIITTGMQSKFWTHAAVYVGKGKLIEALSAGVGDSTISHYLEHDRLIKVYRHKYIADSAFFDKLAAFCQTAQNEKFKYGYFGLLFYILSISLPRTWDWLVLDNKLVDRWLRLDEAYFCSEFVADAYREAGAPIAPYQSWRVKPSDFIKNPLFYEVEI